jgi:hypothetical protein
VRPVARNPYWQRLARDRWAEGACPCCGQELGGVPAVIGEGVRICGGCAEHVHDGWAEAICSMILAGAR